MSDSDQAILFYNSNELYYEFSNFYTNKHMKLTIDGQEWQNTEQYFQAQKFYVPGSQRHMEYYDIIKACDSPMKTMILGRQRLKGGYAGKWIVNKKTDARTMNEAIRLYSDVRMREDWDAVKDDVMYKALMVKFGVANPALHKILMDTGSLEIIEASPRDAYWGWGKDKKGLNMLGKLLVQVREHLRP
jgi:N-glycosidase YbiA